MSYHRRVIALSYKSESLPMFASNAEQDEFHRIIGRLVTYGMQRDASVPSQQELVTISAFYPEEMVAQYFPAQPERNKPYPNKPYPNSKAMYYLGSQEEELDSFINKYVTLATGTGKPRAFVLGAVKHSDGKYGTHS